MLPPLESTKRGLRGLPSPAASKSRAAASAVQVLGCTVGEWGAVSASLLFKRRRRRRGSARGV